MVEIVPATEAHVMALYGKPLPVTITGLAAIEAGQVQAVAALYPENGCMVLVLRVRDEFRSNRIRLTRLLLTGARRMLALARKSRLPVHAVADPAYPRSADLIQHLGGAHIGKDTYQWPISH